MKYLDAYLARQGLPPRQPENCRARVQPEAAKLTQPLSARGFVSFAHGARGEPETFDSIVSEVTSVSRASDGGGGEPASPLTQGVELWRYEVAGWSRDRRELFEERAAIMEFDGGLTRAEAERRAFLVLQPIRY